MEEVEEDNDPPFRFLGMPLGVWLGLAVLIAIVGAVISWIDYNNAEEWVERGQRGDFLGGHLAAFATLISTLLFFITLQMQRFELELQRKELRQSRKVAREQRDALERQNKIAATTSAVSRILQLADLRVELLRRSNELDMHLGVREVNGSEPWDERAELESRTDAVEALMKDLIRKEYISPSERDQLLGICGLDE